MEPEPITSAAVVLIVAVFKRFTASAVRFDRQVIDERTDLITHFCVERRTVDVVRHVVHEIDVTGMVHVAPTRTANNRAARDLSCRAVCLVGSRDVKVNGIAPARVRPGAGDQLAIRIKLRIVVGTEFIGSTEFIETGVRHLHVVGVHEHHMATPIDGCVL